MSEKSNGWSAAEWIEAAVAVIIWLYLSFSIHDHGTPFEEGSILAIAYSVIAGIFVIFMVLVAFWIPIIGILSVRSLRRRAWHLIQAKPFFESGLGSHPARKLIGKEPSKVRDFKKMMKELTDFKSNLKAAESQTDEYIKLLVKESEVRAMRYAGYALESANKYKSDHAEIAETAAKAGVHLPSATPTNVSSLSAKPRK